MESSPIGSDFQDFLNDLWTEAEQEGNDAVREVAFAAARARLARQIHVARRGRGLTQSELAQATGIDQSEISRIEAGQSNPTLRTISLLMHALRYEILLEPQDSARHTTGVGTAPARASRPNT